MNNVSKPGTDGQPENLMPPATADAGAAAIKKHDVPRDTLKLLKNINKWWTMQQLFCGCYHDYFVAPTFFQPLASNLT